MTITQNELKQHLHYEPATGVFTWLTSSFSNNGRGHNIGDVVGYKDRQGYVVLCLNGKQHLAHRLAFLYMTGETPLVVDHKNHITNDNRFENLRSTGYSENSCNKKIMTNNTTGVKGLNITYRNKNQCYYRAQVKKDKINFCKYFAFTPVGLEEATAWLDNKRTELHGEFARNE